MQITESDIKIIHRVATWYARKMHQDADELESVAVLAVLEEQGLSIRDWDSAINAIATNAIRKFVSENTTIRIPQRSRTTLKLKDPIMETSSPGTSILSKSIDPREEVELLECLRFAAVTPMEKAYIELRIAGHTNVEITIELDISESAASRMLKSIERRFNKEWYDE